MVKIRKISEIEPTLGFTEFDILEKYRQSFEKSELGRLHSLFPFSELAQQMGLHESRLGRKSYFSAKQEGTYQNLPERTFRIKLISKIDGKQKTQEETRTIVYKNQLISIDF